MDSDGTVRALIRTSGQDDGHSVTFSLLDAAGTEVLSAHVSDAGGSVAIWQNGNVTAALHG